jgi:Homeodomain-like domain
MLRSLGGRDFRKGELRKIAASIKAGADIRPVLEQIKRWPLSKPDANKLMDQLQEVQREQCHKEGMAKKRLEEAPQRAKDRLKAKAMLMVKDGIPMAEVASEIGVDRTTIWRWWKAVQIDKIIFDITTDINDMLKEGSQRRFTTNRKGSPRKQRKA